MVPEVGISIIGADPVKNAQSGPWAALYFDIIANWLYYSSRICSVPFLEANEVDNYDYRDHR